MSFPDISEQHLIFFIARAEMPTDESESMKGTFSKVNSQ